jgi:hypothetical protein
MTRIALLLPLILTVAALACRAGDESSDPEIDVGDIDAYDYYSLLNGRSLGVWEKRYPIDVDSDGEWRALVDKQRAKGLSELSDDERTQLLTVAANAYFMIVADVTFEARSGDGAITTIVERFRPDAEGWFIELAERRHERGSIDLDWGDVAFLDDDPADEWRGFFQFDADLAEYWELRSSQWTCESGDIDDGFGFLAALYVFRLFRPIDSEPADEQRIGGRSVTPVWFDDRVPAGGGLSALSWIDELTLWPIRIDYTFDIPTFTPPQRHEYIVWLTSVNTDPEVERPGPASDFGQTRS